MSMRTSLAARRRRLATWVACFALLLNGFASVLTHAAPGAVVRLAAAAQICSAQMLGAGANRPAAHASFALDDDGDAGSSVRAAHCALCLGQIDPLAALPNSPARLAKLVTASGPARDVDAQLHASREHKRAQPRAPPPTA